MRLILMNVMMILVFIAAFVVPNSHAGILDWFSKRNNKIKIVDLKQDNAEPLTWLSDNTIVIGKEASIYLYDIKCEALLEKVADSYDVSNFQSTNCFTSDASVFSVRRHIGIGKDGKIFTKESFRYIADWQQPSKNKYVEFAIWWNTNQLDCTIFNYQDRKEYTKRREIEDAYYSAFYSPPLFKSIHGESFLFVKKQSDNKYAKHIELGRKPKNAQDTNKDSYKQLQLAYDGMPHGIEKFPHKIKSFYDSYKGNYVLYEETNIFDLRKGAWPISAWRVTPNLELVERYTLPPGPWVKKYSIIKKLSGFDISLEERSHMKLHGGGGRIYVHIWGKAIDNDEAGIYILEMIDGKARWSNLYFGNFKNNIIVSPDGCNIVFSDQKNRLKKIETCNFNKK